MSDSNKQSSSQPNPALRNPAEAAKLLAELRGIDPIAALDELNGWLESAHDIAGDDEKIRGELLTLIQDTGEAHVSALTAQFLAPPAGGKAAHDAKWNALNNYLRGLTGALYITATRLLKQAVGNPSLQPAAAAAAARSLHACRMLAKTYLMRYLGIPPKLWRLAYGIELDAEDAGCAASQVRLHAALKATTTPSQELLRLLMLHLSAPEMMPPEQIEVADRAIEQLGGDFTLRPRGVTDNVFRFDLGSDQPPHRAAGAPPNAQYRYFGPGMGFDGLERLHRESAKAGGAEFRAFGKDIAPHAQAAAVRHLMVFWGPNSPYSPPSRQEAKGSLHVIHGYGQAWQHLSRVNTTKTELSLVEEGDGPAQQGETWALQHTGGNEVGAEVPPGSTGWARCGTVLGVSGTDQGGWWLGIIRSLHADPEGGLRAHIAVLSHEPRTVELLTLVAKGEETVYSTEASRQFAFSRTRGIILADGSSPSPMPNLMLPAESWKEGRTYETTYNGAPRMLRALQLLRRGDDYVRATFEWLEQK